MNKLLVVVPYKLWFCSSNIIRGLLGLQIHALESISFWALWSSNSIILGVVWWSFNEWWVDLVGVVYVPGAVQKKLEPMLGACSPGKILHFLSAETVSGGFWDLSCQWYLLVPLPFNIVCFLPCGARSWKWFVLKRSQKSTHLDILAIQISYIAYMFVEILWGGVIAPPPLPPPPSPFPPPPNETLTIAPANLKSLALVVMEIWAKMYPPIARNKNVQQHNETLLCTVACGSPYTCHLY